MTNRPFGLCIYRPIFLVSVPERERTLINIPWRRWNYPLVIEKRFGRLLPLSAKCCLSTIQLFVIDNWHRPPPQQGDVNSEHEMKPLKKQDLWHEAVSSLSRSVSYLPDCHSFGRLLDVPCEEQPLCDNTIIVLLERSLGGSFGEGRNMAKRPPYGKKVNHGFHNLNLWP